MFTSKEMIAATLDRSRHTSSKSSFMDGNASKPAKPRIRLRSQIRHYLQKVLKKPSFACEATDLLKSLSLSSSETHRIPLDFPDCATDDEMNDLNSSCLPQNLNLAARKSAEQVRKSTDSLDELLYDIIHRSPSARNCADLISEPERRSTSNGLLQPAAIYCKASKRKAPKTAFSS